jgi:hypothetical protein
MAEDDVMMLNLVAAHFVFLYWEIWRQDCRCAAIKTRKNFLYLLIDQNGSILIPVLSVSKIAFIFLLLACYP